MKRRKRTRLLVAGDVDTAMFASAADRLDWKVAAVSGGLADDIRSETGAKIVELERLLDSIGAEIAVVGTSGDRRVADAERLLARGIGVVLIPAGLTSDHDLPTATDQLVIGEPVPMAPAVQRWMQVVQSFGQVDRVWINTSASRAASACSLAVLTARLLGWPTADKVEIKVIDDPLPRFEAQAAGPTDAATMTLFPNPTVEHNGSDMSPPPVRHPADAFGATDLLRRFSDDLATETTPILGIDFLAEVWARQENL